MSLRGIIRSAAIGACVYGAVKMAEFVGICKGVVMGCRIAKNCPDEAVKVADDWDELEEKWEALKAQYKKA